MNDELRQAVDVLRDCLINGWHTSNASEVRRDHEAMETLLAAVERMDAVERVAFTWQETAKELQAKLDTVEKERDGYRRRGNELALRVQFIASDIGHAPCRSGGIDGSGVCANTCICDWPKDIRIAVDEYHKVEAQR